MTFEEYMAGNFDLNSDPPYLSLNEIPFSLGDMRACWTAAQNVGISFDDGHLPHRREDEQQ